ncbi:hypothetical protein SDC9_190002 [bioreactor metagenome]|uniref:Uncharacterized protein n=1 Tax=bioreactor metagenome TaxID=1076179 RepID=A0A645HTQ4_9ZZZZ
MDRARAEVALRRVGKYQRLIIELLPHGARESERFRGDVHLPEHRVGKLRRGTVTFLRFAQLLVDMLKAGYIRDHRDDALDAVRRLGDTLGSDTPPLCRAAIRDTVRVIYEIVAAHRVKDRRSEPRQVFGDHERKYFD